MLKTNRTISLVNSRKFRPAYIYEIEIQRLICDYCTKNSVGLDALDAFYIFVKIPRTLEHLLEKRLSYGPTCPIFEEKQIGYFVKLSDKISENFTMLYKISSINFSGKLREIIFQIFTAPKP